MGVWSLCLWRTIFVQPAGMGIKGKVCGELGKSVIPFTLDEKPGRYYVNEEEKNIRGGKNLKKKNITLKSSHTDRARASRKRIGT